jgi:hypothetical protein
MQQETRGHVHSFWNNVPQGGTRRRNDYRRKRIARQISNQKSAI